MSNENLDSGKGGKQIMVECIIAMLSDPNIKAAIMLSKMSIRILKKSFSQDATEVMKKKIADSELRTAQHILNSLEFETEQNWKYGVHRVITHLESAFDLYIEKEEFESSCICGLYLSYMHKMVGNIQDELHKRIWMRVPIPSKNAIGFGKYGPYVSIFFSHPIYQDILTQRKEKRLKIIDAKIQYISMTITIYGHLFPTIGALKPALVVLKKEKRELLNESEQYPIVNATLDFIKPAWWDLV